VTSPPYRALILLLRMFPAYRALPRRLETLGPPLNIVMTFGQRGNADPGERLARKRTGGGSVLDWGVYCIQLALAVFGSEEPERVVASGLLNPAESVDTALR